MGLKHLLLSVIGIAVTAAVIATIVSERNNPSGSDILIPTLNLSAAPRPGTSLLGALSGGIPVNEYTIDQSLQGVIIRQDEHNLVSCPQGAMPNIPVTTTSGNFQIPGGTRFWGYQYSGRENANYAAGKTKLFLFDGTFYLSQGQINDPNNTIDQQNLYSDINKLTRLDSSGSGKQLYFMSEIDLCFSCGQGLQTANACPGHGAASSSSSVSSSSSGTGALSSSSSSTGTGSSVSSSSSSSSSSVSSISSSSSSVSSISSISSASSSSSNSSSSNSSSSSSSTTSSSSSSSSFIDDSCLGRNPGDLCPGGVCGTGFSCIPCQSATCPNGYTCQPPTGCVPTSSSSYSSSSLSSSSSSSSASQGAICGNGTVEAPEQCDDGNTNDGDACFSNCRWVVPPASL